MHSLRKTLPFIIIIAAVPGLAQNPAGHVTGRILAQRTRNANAAAVARAYNSHGVTVVKSIPQLGLDVLSVPEAAAPGIIRSLEARGLFTFVETDGLAKGAAVPNDPYFPSQWHLSTINGPAAWDITTGNAAVPIAMVDSGVDATHPDLSSKVIPGYSFLTSNTNTADVLGHGTATAGTAAAASNNAGGITGVAWLNPIMPLVVLDSTDYASYSNIASAITYAADHGARIINVSIGGSSASSTLQSAVTYAWNKGSVVFASAMNNSTSTPYYPAACDLVVSVSATEPTDTLSSFSNYGSWIDLSAPGNNILTTQRGGGYSTWYGTSFSSPIAAATGALALGINPALSATALVNLLQQNSDDIGAPGWDPNFGWGRINAYRTALAATNSISADKTAPTVSIASPTPGAVVSGVLQVTGPAADNVAVMRAELWIDGNLDSTCASSAFSCAWNSSAYAVGSHALAVKAYDAAGNAGSATETVNVVAISAPDNTAPLVQILNPVNSAIVSGNVAVQVQATDNVGVTQVGIYVDNTLKATLTAAPYNYNWSTRKVPYGTHSITAKAWDASGNTASVSISVRK